MLGVLLFFFGLIAGLFVPMMANPRMGLTTHLEGIMNGLFLMLLGLLWQRLELSSRWLAIGFGTVVYGSFANFAAVFIASMTGAGAMMPIAGGREGAPLVETVISFLLISLALAMLVTCIIVLTGLVKNIRSNNGGKNEKS